MFLHRRFRLIISFCNRGNDMMGFLSKNHQYTFQTGIIYIFQYTEWILRTNVSMEHVIPRQLLYTPTLKQIPRYKRNGSSK